MHAGDTFEPWLEFCGLSLIEFAHRMQPQWGPHGEGLGACHDVAPETRKGGSGQAHSRLSDLVPAPRKTRKGLSGERLRTVTVAMICLSQFLSIQKTDRGAYRS